MLNNKTYTDKTSLENQLEQSHVNVLGDQLTLPTHSNDTPQTQPT